MKIRILNITHKMPTWINEGYHYYAKKLSPPWSLEIIDIPAEKRGANADTKKILDREGEKLLSAVKPNHRVIALDVKGKSFSTETLAAQLNSWQQTGEPIDLLVGGPEGLSAACLKRADACWSLSPLTFPHLLIRLIVAEQVYRVFSILTNHPYHRM